MALLQWASNSSIDYFFLHNAKSDDDEGKGGDGIQFTKEQGGSTIEHINHEPLEQLLLHEGILGKAIILTFVLLS
eukprot:scaffold1323_cov113-Cylindrotheca_fusiformis.AAC.13